MATAVTPSDAPAPTNPTDEGYGIGPRVALAALSAGAGVVHFAMVPIHAAESPTEGILFALSGWFQLLVAAALIVKPNRRWLQATVLANLVFIGAWAWSRTLGLPFGAHSGVAEKIDTIDTLTVVLEGLLIIGAAALLLKPNLARNASAGALVVGSAVPVAVLLLTTLAIASPAASQHDHGSTVASGPAPGSIQAQLTSIEANRCDKDINPASYWQEAQIANIDTVGITLTDTSGGATASDGHAHSHGAAPAAAGSSGTTTTTRPDPLQGRGSPLLDKLVAKMGSSSEVDAGILVAELSKATPEEYESFLLLVGQNAGHNHSATGDDTGGHGGHIGPNPWVAMTDKAQCDQLKKELQISRDVAMSMPTAADAKAAGYTQVTPYVPGIAAHWMKFPYVDGKFEVDKPEMVLYDGNGLDAHVVGLSYYIIQPGDNEPTQGFTGVNDHFHRHIGLCQRGAMVVGDSTTTEEQCAALGGKKATNAAGWMNHTWIVPGCESPWGMFSGASPVLDMQLSQKSGQDGGSCNGSGSKARYDLRPGTNQAPTTTVPGSETAAGK